MIITDYWMPEMTGFELLKRVKVRPTLLPFYHPCLETIDRVLLPCTVISGVLRAEGDSGGHHVLRERPQQDHQVPLLTHLLLRCPSSFSFISCLLACRCLEEGAEEFLLKPIRPSDVSRVCSRVLK